MVKKFTFDEMQEDDTLEIRPTNRTQSFVEYCIEFYGTSGVYPMATSAEIETACIEHIRNTGERFEGDTIDRESVRDILAGKKALHGENLLSDRFCVISTHKVGDWVAHIWDRNANGFHNHNVHESLRYSIIIAHPNGSSGSVVEYDIPENFVSDILLCRDAKRACYAAILKRHDLIGTMVD